ncbi:hypothetical protein EC957_008721 [Mortierella hygrophila]|uniref:Uncharacterized protein n=1 Tax=Mortierella hygrophila TaxID=979708 RepID=A0A9P6FBV5_9FUNG|nr:hypothetical protein EC957_008721 [Mortierella hygrophila]
MHSPETVWRMPRTRKLRRTLWQAVKRPGEEEEEEPEQHTPSAWTVCHIYRGLVLKALAKQWSKVFKDVAKSITQHVSRLFCRYVEKEAREQIWKPRRERTIRRKLREDERLCGQAVAEHREQRCPGEQSDTRVADQAVIVTLLGLRRMDIMERRGNMVIKELEEEHT